MQQEPAMPASGKAKDYGVGLGPYKPIAPEDFGLSLQEGGIDTSMSAQFLPEGQSPNALDVQMDEGGVSNDYGRSAFGTAYAGAGDKTILHLAPYQKDDSTKFTMRLRDVGWDRWNGTAWAVLTGALTGNFTNRYYSVVMQNLFVAANGKDRLKSWNGSDVSAVQDLSADAPRAEFITRIGNRILAASIRDGAGVLDPHGVAWSENGSILGWTSALLGAGAASLLPEGSNESANHIKGVSTLARGGVIYRQRSIVLATLTGIGAAPFRFTTIDFSHGTESPYSIANGGPKTGDFFLGDDLMVYYYSGEAMPQAIGLPILNDLIKNITDPRVVVGRIDRQRMEYWLGIPTSALDSWLRIAWVFSIKEFERSGRLVWRKRQLQATTATLGFGPVPTSADPVVDTVTNIVDTVNRVVDSFTTGSVAIMFGHNDGTVTRIDESLALASGVWESKLFGESQTERELDTISIDYLALTTAQVELSISTNGGATYNTPRLFNLSVTGSGERNATDTFKVLGKKFQVRIRILAGHCTVTKVYFVINNRGRRATP